MTKKTKHEPYLIQCRCLDCGNKWRQRSDEKRICGICKSKNVQYRKYGKDPNKEPEPEE